MKLSFEKTSKKELLELMAEIYQVMLDSRMKPEVASDRLRVMEPFYRFPEVVEAFLESAKKGKV